MRILSQIFISRPQAHDHCMCTAEYTYYRDAECTAYARGPKELSASTHALKHLLHKPKRPKTTFLSWQLAITTRHFTNALALAVADEEP